MSTILDPVLTLPDQLRWGLDIEAPGVAGDRPIALLGMGGSAMAATVGGLAVTGDNPVEVHRSYGLPGWAVGSGAAVIAVSYSGNTEEVLSGVDAAIGAGLDMTLISSGGRLEQVAAEHSLPIVLVPGGMQPRAAVGYQAAAVARVLGSSGLIGDSAGALAEAAGVVDELLAGGSGPAVEQGAAIADKIGDRTTIIYGGHGVGATAAYRWKTQFNENAKVPAYAGVVPEMNHNELEGWRAETGKPFALAYLLDRDDHPRIKKRLALSAAVIGDAVTDAGSVRSSGDGPFARFFSLAVVGDVASLLVAEAAGTDPTPVDTIERFKVSLEEGDE
jgi:glucose/mannose-6-phosphate isomerase